AGGRQVQVERGEVVYVSGNEVVVKMESGEVRHVTVPDGARATVDGKEISVRELKPGMKLQRTITTTTTPRTVTTVRTVSGKVWQVSAPNSVILTLADGTNKQYKIPKGQKFMIDGQEKTAFDLRKGMNVSATVVTAVPETVVAQQRKVTGSAPPPPPTPPMEGALLIETPAPAPAAAPAPSAPEPPPTSLPKTGSVMPLIGLLGLLCSGLSLGLRMLRRS
ncbi:MAG TPA: LPXTG cell wall anchor domain-containing protein, partial [Terriglobia bacterium]|nr:LPXTG cell wall anchor domain-containing protein [Terriglobia bacterium]